MAKTKVHSIRYNFIMNFLLTASNFIFPLITFPYASRVLTATGNGKVAFVASVANYFSLCASLGIPTYGIRACAQVRDDKEKLSQVVQELLIINVVTTSIVLITYTISVVAIPRFSVERELFFINGVNIFLNMLGMNWLYKALEKYDYITIRSLSFKFLSIILMLLLIHGPQDYVAYGALTVLAAVGSNILNVIRSRRLISFAKRDSYSFRRHIRPILMLSAQTLAVSIYNNLDIVMLGFIKPPAEVGYYNAAMRIKGLLLSLVTSLANVLLPRMSYLAKEGDRERFIDLLGKALRFTLMLSLPLCTYLFCYAQESMLVLAGDGYRNAIPAMQAIVLAVVPNGLSGVLGIQVLVSLEREHDLLISVVIGAIVDFLLNLVMIPLYGATGAAISTLVAEVCVTLYQMHACHKLLRMARWASASVRHLIFVLISAAVSLIVTGRMVLHPFACLLLSGCVFFSVYVGLLFLSKDEDMLQYLAIPFSRFMHNRDSRKTQ